MAILAHYNRRSKKKVESGQSDREVSTALFLLRCKQIGLSLAELDELTMGMVFDMFTERANDQCEDYVKQATQADIDAF